MYIYYIIYIYNLSVIYFFSNMEISLMNIGYRIQKSKKKAELYIISLNVNTKIEIFPH